MNIFNMFQLTNMRQKDFLQRTKRLEIPQELSDDGANLQRLMTQIPL